MSTCIAASVGAIAIVVVIYGSADQTSQSTDQFLPDFSQIAEPVDPQQLEPQARLPDGLAWVAPKSDRLVFATGAVSTRYIVEESVNQRRSGRDYIVKKPYARIVGRLAVAPADYSDVIPPFNPLKLYGDSQKSVFGTGDGQTAVQPQSNIIVRFVELLGGLLPAEDGQELDNREVAELVAQAARDEAQALAATVAATPPAADTVPETQADAGAAAPYTTELPKSDPDLEALEDIAGRETRVVKAAAGETLDKFLARNGASVWQAQAMVEAAKSAFPDLKLGAGQAVQLTMVPSLTQAGLEPAQFSIVAPAGDHKITVARNSSGEFAARVSPIEAGPSPQLSLADRDEAQAASVYASVYHAGLVQGVPPESILKIMKVHVYETDFRRRVTPGDTVEFFFDFKSDKGLDGPPGELLYSSITVGGDTARYYRFRTPDGIVDYFDEYGNNSKKFLMRKPVRGSEVRLTSGYGLRFHPLLNERKMHSGVDWAAPPGTPILAAGNGTIEEAGRKGQYGNYVRIRHANGYQTAYGHLLRLGDGIKVGTKVRQGNVIGYVGSTGLSSGPHLHFEVLVNSRFVDPLSIQVPQERQLTGRDLAEFQEERARIEGLLRQEPVKRASR